MTRNDVEVFAKTGKREMLKGSGPKSYIEKTNNVEVKICKHVAWDGWCGKNHQRCPVFNRQFINL